MAPLKPLAATGCTVPALETLARPRMDNTNNTHNTRAKHVGLPPVLSLAHFFIDLLGCEVLCWESMHAYF